jgi:hypothetical protein
MLFISAGSYIRAGRAAEAGGMPDGAIKARIENGG